jgi:uncharacterized membrane protein
LEGGGNTGNKMTTKTARAIRRLHLRPRLLVSILCGILLYVVLPDRIAGANRFAVAWDCGVTLDLSLLFHMMGTATSEEMRAHAQREDETRWVILILTIAAAVSSLAAIGIILRDAKALGGIEAILEVILAGFTILCSWGFTHTIAAIHYAHDYYGDDPRDETPLDPAGGLRFPNETAPDYWDFLYFSFVIGMTCQVSDVQVTGRRMRRLTLLHGIVSFFFNTVILALTINIAASLMG